MIFVQNAQNVGIVGLIVDGSQNGLTECAPFLVGVLYQGATGTLDHDAIRNMQLSADLNGCQSGDAVDVDSTGSPVTVTISNNSINGYQKNGVTANDVGTTAFVRHNVISGVGRTTGAAQNGIQIGYGAAGEVIGNSVANNYYLPCTGPNSCAASGDWDFDLRVGRRAGRGEYARIEPAQHLRAGESRERAAELDCEYAGNGWNQPDREQQPGQPEQSGA